MNTPHTPHDPDRLVERLRRGLDEFTSSVRRDPPDLDVPMTTATDSLGGGGGRGRWPTAAAAAAFVVAAVGSIVWVAGDTDAPTAAPATQPPLTAPSEPAIEAGGPGSVPAGRGTAEDGADVFVAEEAPGSGRAIDNPLVVELKARRDYPGALVSGQVVLQDGCVLLDAGERLELPVWPLGTTWDPATESVVLDDGTTIAIGSAIESGGGYGRARAVRQSRQQVLDIPGDIEASGRVECVPEADPAPYDDNVVYALSAIEVVSLPAIPAATIPAPGTIPQDGDTTAGVVWTIATVLASSDHGPQLCNAVADSYPPQCAGADIVDWDWSLVESEAASGTRWGEYVLVGSYNSDGTEFALSEPARTPTEEDYARPTATAEPDFSTPCDEPAGGWDSPYPAEFLDEAQVRRQVDGFAGLWIDEAAGVYNIKLVGDGAARDAAESTIGEFYKGPVCIVEAEYTMRELTTIQNQVTRLMPDNRIVSVGVNVLSNRLVVSLSAPAREFERELTAEHGKAITFEYSAVEVAGTPSTVEGAAPSTGAGNLPTIDGTVVGASPWTGEGASPTTGEAVTATIESTG